MATINVTFTQALLKNTHVIVKKLIPTVNLKKDAWVYNYGGCYWEFQTIPQGTPLEKFCWYGSAENAYDARAKGWDAYLNQFHKENYDKEF